MIVNWLVVYDISEDRTRVKTSKILEGFGDRVQDSVFEVIFTRDQELDELKRELGQLSLELTDSIRFYPLCAKCSRSVFHLGSNEPLPFHRPDYIIV